MSDFTHPPYHLTGSASLGASLGVAAAAIAVSIAHAHGFDLGTPISGVFVVTFSTATTSIGNQVGMRIERAAAKRAVRRQAAYICKRVGAIVEPQARSLVLQCIKETLADWDAGFLTDSVMRDRFLNEIYRRYVGPSDARLASLDSDRLLPTVDRHDDSLPKSH